VVRDGRLYLYTYSQEAIDDTVFSIIKDLHIWPMNLILTSQSSVHDDKESLKRYIVIICYLNKLIVKLYPILSAQTITYGKPSPILKKGNFHTIL